MSRWIIGDSGATIAELNDVSTSSLSSLDILQRNASGQWVNRQPLGTEASQTLNSGAANDTVVGAGSQRFAFFTMATTAPFFYCTGIEWKNGTVVNGNTNCAIFSIDAIYPSSASVQLVAWGRQITQSGASAVQRNSAIEQASFLRSGAIYGVMIDTSSASGTYQTATVASANNSKTIAASADYPLGNTTAWTATTEEPYFKVYYKPVLGV